METKASAVRHYCTACYSPAIVQANRKLRCSNPGCKNRTFSEYPDREPAFRERGKFLGLVLGRQDLDLLPEEFPNHNQKNNPSQEREGVKWNLL